MKPLVPKSRIPLGHLLLFGWLPSPIKIWAYRTFLGYRIGHHVSIAFGGGVVGRDVELGDYVSIGLLVIVQGRSIRMRRYSSIATMSYVSCEHIEIGEDARIREQVYVGGPQLPESRFVLGDRTIVLQMAYINATKPVVVGTDSCIGGHCLVFSHGVWLNTLDGYSSTHAPVSIGESVWLPWRVFVMPGVSIGDGTVISGNSFVADSIPARSLAAGSPAKVVRSGPDFPIPPTEAERATLVETMVREFERYIEYHGIVVHADGPVRTYIRGPDRWRLLWLRETDALASTGVAPHDTVLSEVALSHERSASYRARDIDWLDLAGRTRSRNGTSLTEELAQFLSRYGIRLARD